jgi:hypothetical protein
MKRNEILVFILQIAGAFTICIGIGLAIWLVKQQPTGMFSSNTGPSNEVIAFAYLVGFYHCVLALLCFGVAKAVKEASRDQQQVAVAQTKPDKPNESQPV